MYNTCKINDNLYLGKPFLLVVLLLVSLSLFSFVAKVLEESLVFL